MEKLPESIWYTIVSYLNPVDIENVLCFIPVTDRIRRLAFSYKNIYELIDLDEIDLAVEKAFNEKKPELVWYYLSKEKKKEIKKNILEKIIKSYNKIVNNGFVEIATSFKEAALAELRSFPVYDMSNQTRRFRIIKDCLNNHQEFIALMMTDFLPLMPHLQLSLLNSSSNLNFWTVFNPSREIVSEFLKHGGAVKLYYTSTVDSIEILVNIAKNHSIYEVNFINASYTSRALISSIFGVRSP